MKTIDTGKHESRCRESGHFKRMECFLLLSTINGSENDVVIFSFWVDSIHSQWLIPAGLLDKGTRYCSVCLFLTPAWNDSIDTVVYTSALDPVIMSEYRQALFISERTDVTFTFTFVQTFIYLIIGAYLDTRPSVCLSAWLYVCTKFFVSKRLFA